MEERLQKQFEMQAEAHAVYLLDDQCGWLVLFQMQTGKFLGV